MPRSQTARCGSEYGPAEPDFPKEMHFVGPKNPLPIRKTSPKPQAPPPGPNAQTG